MKPNLKLSLSSICLFLFFQTTIIAQTTQPTFSHIVIVIGENTRASSVYGSTSAPYINALAAQGAKFTNSFGVFHPSQPNYIALYSGSNQGITKDNLVTTKFTTANLGRELINAGKTFTTFSEDLPSVGFDGATSGSYARKHNPAANWMGTGTNQIPTTTNQPFTAFPTNFNNLPAVSFVIPNLCNDGHNSCAPISNGTLQYDTFLKTKLDAYKKWCINNNSLLIVTYDEDDFTTVNKIATVVYGAKVATGEYAQTINHYSVLRTIENAFGLTTHAGAAATATPLNCWITGASKNAVITSDTNNLETKISLFPNPVDGATISVFGIDNNTKYQILNTTGLKMADGILENDSIPVDKLPKGIYYIQFNQQDKVISKSFIKK